MPIGRYACFGRCATLACAQAQPLQESTVTHAPSPHTPPRPRRFWHHWPRKLRELEQLESIAELSRQRRLAARYIKVVFLVARWEVLDRLKLHAQALTFDTLLALVPSLVVVFSIFEGFGGMRQVQARLEALIVENLSGSPQVQQVLSEYLRTFVNNVQGGQIGAVSVMLLVFSVLSLLGHIEFAFNSIFGARAQRPLAVRLMSYWAILTLGPVLLAASFALTAALQTSAIEALLERLGPLAALFIAATPLLVTWIAFTTMYAVVPRIQVRLTSALSAAIIAGSLWNAAKYGYALYAKHAFTLQNIYGSLAAIPLFIVWLYVSWLLVLFGAQLAFAFEHAESYRQSPNAPTSYAYQELALCRLFLEVARDFCHGTGPTSPRAAAQRIGIAGHHVGELVALLKKGRFVEEVAGTEALVPARDPERVTVYDIIHFVRTGTGALPPLVADDATQHIQQLLDARDAQQQEMAEAVTFRALAMRHP